MKKLPLSIGFAVVGFGLVAPAPADAAEQTATVGSGPAVGECTAEPTVIGGVDLGCLTEHLFGDVAVMGSVAKERTSGSFAYAGTIVTDETSLGKWDRILEKNPTQASASFGRTAYLDSDPRSRRCRRRVHSPVGLRCRCHQRAQRPGQVPERRGHRPPW